jgi:phenylacetate-CoA ligase
VTSDDQQSTAGRLTGDVCERDWIWDRPVETASPDETFALAAPAWRTQLNHLRNGSPFFRRKLEEAGAGASNVGLGDLQRLPFTTKEELKQAIEADPPFGSHLGVAPELVKRVYQTSGSTGAPSLIALTRADVDTWTAIGTRTYFATGIHDHSAVLSTFGAGPFVAGHTHFVLSRIGARSVPVAPGDTDRVLFGLRAGIADTLIGTPSFAQYLANRLEQERTDPRSLALAHIVTGGEPGGGIPAVRDHIQDVLGVTVNEVMGIGDVAPSLFGECPRQLGMHFCGTGYIWPELVDAETREPLAIEEGAVGELVYTSLAREAMPVLRFLSADIVRIEGTSCECGRTSFRMRCIGRRDDMFIVRGVNVYPTAILAVVGEFRPAVTGRARAIRTGAGVSVEPPIPIEVEIPNQATVESDLASRIEAEIRARLTFRSRVTLIPEGKFGDSGYKTRLTVTRP